MVLTLWNEPRLNKLRLIFARQHQGWLEHIQKRSDQSTILETY